MEPPPEVGTLYLAPPLAHTLGPLRDALRRVGLEVGEPAPHLITVDLKPGILARVVDGLDGAISPAELRDTRSVIVAEGERFGLSDLAAMQPLATLMGRTRGAWLSQMVRDGRLISYFQPIVHAGDPGRVFAYECLIRGIATDGTVVPPGRLYQAARDADMMFPLDREARLAAIRNAAGHGLDSGDVGLFINFNPSSIYNPNACLRSTLAAVDGTALRPEKIAFEVVESDHIQDINHLSRIVAFYREAGFRIALDDLGAGYASLNLLGGLRPDFVKFDMEMVRGVDRDAYKAGILGKMMEMARELGTSTIAEGVETEGEFQWVVEHGADYVQGYYVARPASPPPRPRLLQPIQA